MNLKEHDNNQYTKEKDKVEAYLLRIIQRYFDIENNFTRESIEAMIIESLTRFKQAVIHQKGFIFSLNKMTGNLTLTIQDFGGEPAIKKQSAYNKDFGTEADTICMGNDPRLSDDREAAPHVHRIANVQGLKEALDIIGMPSDTHFHENKTVLDILQYTGTQTVIDLVVIDNLKVALTKLYNSLSNEQINLESRYKKDFENLLLCIPQLEQMIQEASDLAHQSVKWLQDINSYTDTEVNRYKLNTLYSLIKYITKEQSQYLQDFIKQSYVVKSDGEFALRDGEFSLVPVEDEVKQVASATDGDSLWNIYLTGLRLGLDDWQWDDTSQAFVYQSNETETYPCFISLLKFKSYTHRVRLTSSNADNDCISAVIAYDEASGANLSLIINNGDVSPAGAEGSASATVILNFTGKDHAMVGDFIVGTTVIGPGIGWSGLTNGVSVLIKRNENHIQIWTAYDENPDWSLTYHDNTQDIYPTESPLFDFNLTDYPELSALADKPGNYGYGCFSQPYSTYEDIYIAGAVAYDEPYGHVNVNEASQTAYQIDSSTLENVQNGNIKMFFRYEKEGKTFTAPLPFNFIDDDGNHIVIQGTYAEDGQVNIQSNCMNQLGLYATDNNWYDDNTIIVAHNIKKNYYILLTDDVQELECSICKIDSDEKNAFVTGLLSPDVKYLINGELSFVDNLYYDTDYNELTYFKWADGHPVVGDDNIVICNGLWESANADKKYGFIAEYKVKRLSQYFENPRIYYQVLGTEEE